jgi:hypothetical protein
MLDDLQMQWTLMDSDFAHSVPFLRFDRHLTLVFVFATFCLSSQKRPNGVSSSTHEKLFHFAEFSVGATWREGSPQAVQLDIGEL